MEEKNHTELKQIIYTSNNDNEYVISVQVSKDNARNYVYTVENTNTLFTFEDEINLESLFNLILYLLTMKV